MMTQYGMMDFRSKKFQPKIKLMINLSPLSIYCDYKNFIDKINISSSEYFEL